MNSDLTLKETTRGKLNIIYQRYKFRFMPRDNSTVFSRLFYSHTLRKQLFAFLGDIEFWGLTYCPSTALRKRKTDFEQVAHLAETQIRPSDSGL